MNYLLKSKRTPAPRRKQFLISFGIFTIVISLFFLFPSFFSGTFSYAAHTVWSVEQTVLSQSEGLIAFFASRTQLLKDNQSLKDALYDVSSTHTANTVLRAENARLRGILEKVPEGRESILASVLVRPPRTPFDILIVDAGFNHGIKKDSIVTSAGVLLGRVLEVQNSTSQVLLFSTPKTNIDAVISRTGESVHLEGSGGGNFVLVLPRSFDIVVGDILVSPTGDTLIIGEVMHINSDPSSSFQVALLKSPLNINSLRWVLLSPSFNEE
ncbi:MAG: rod shape-determining protein MreC [Patescibacteria group bacterium]